MARDGLSRQECDEILVTLRCECPTIDDEILVSFAESFALDTVVDFDPNDLIVLLNIQGEKLSLKQRFASDLSPACALKTLKITNVDHAITENKYSGGLLILRTIDSAR